jgi:hypothetical protein
MFFIKNKNYSSFKTSFFIYDLMSFRLQNHFFFSIKFQRFSLKINPHTIDFK